MRRQSDKNTNSSIPDDGEIEIILSGFNPKPSQIFYSRIEKTPWRQKSSRLYLSRYNSLVPMRSWLLGIAAMMIVIFLVSLAFIPSVRAVARQVFYSFISSSSRQIELQITPSDPSRLYHDSDPSNFLLTIPEVQNQAGFKVKQITGLAEDFKLVGARFEPEYNAVIILYQGNNYKLFLSQRPSGAGEDVFSIGPDTPVSLIQIGDNQGEFVVGGWKAISTQAISNTNVTPPQTSITATWDEHLPQYTLRWKSEGFSNEIRSIGEGSPSQSDLIDLANRLK